MDKGNLYIAQDANGTISGERFYNYYDPLFDADLLAVIGNSKLITIRPIS
jgi:hypothetical protein